MNPIFIYAFFLVHAGAFSFSGFILFYKAQIPGFGFMHGGIAIIVYIAFYQAIFGKEAVKNMFIGALIGVLQIYSWLELIGSRLMDGKGRYPTFASLPLYFHIIPATYFILYTFLLRNAMIDLLRARNDPKLTNIANWGFYVISGILFFLPSLIGY